MPEQRGEVYCAFCKDPVAKRNFRNRHNHHEEMNTEEGDDSKDTQKAVRKHQERDRERKPPLSTVISSSSNNISEGSGSGSSISKSIEPNDKKRPAASMTAAAPESLSRKFARIDAERKEAWNILLAKRPSSDQSEEMSAWLMQIMAVSDLKKSMTEVHAEAKDTFKKPRVTSNSESPVTSSMESSSSYTRNGSTDSASSSTPSESSPTDGSSNDSSNESSDNQEGATNDSSSETQDPTNS